ncbi:cytochrome c oxidase assembly factor 1 homolog [Physella acuta]|uniref:cytochrome c oxidase assembly factor 1 homolog n=1 Tax=Physella acuta TaxID=109671 RepID=UPI0027DABC26|nr:cytochrome c oxidase assembly factor 1 homolog [Physella acuta]
MYKSPLFKVAVVGGFVVLGSAIWVENRINNNFRAQDYYRNAVTLLHKYEPAGQMLGRPIYSGKLDLSNADKFRVDGTTAKLTIPLKGANDKGTLYVLASRDKLGEPWNIDQLDLEIKSTKARWKFYDRQLASNNRDSESTTQSDNTDSFN